MNGGRSFNRFRYGGPVSGIIPSKNRGKGAIYAAARRIKFIISIENHLCESLTILDKVCYLFFNFITRDGRGEFALTQA